jgi:cell division protein FtsL
MVNLKQKTIFMHFSLAKGRVRPKKMLLSLHVFALIIACASASSQRHHKVRHKHNLLSLRDRHVNEIREAFDEYRNFMHKKNSDSEEDIDNNLNTSEEIFKKLLSSTTVKPRKAYELPAQFFTRNKRVFTTTTTQRSTDDDDEYFDNENDTANRPPNDDAQVRFNRDVSHFRETRKKAS